MKKMLLTLLACILLSGFAVGGQRSTSFQTIASFACGKDRVQIQSVSVSGFMRYIHYPGDVVALHLFANSKPIPNDINRSIIVFGLEHAISEKERIENKLMRVNGIPSCVKWPDSLKYGMSLHLVSLKRQTMRSIATGEKFQGDKMKELPDKRGIIRLMESFDRHVLDKNMGAVAKDLGIPSGQLTAKSYYGRRIDWVLYRNTKSIAKRFANLKVKPRIFSSNDDETEFLAACYLRDKSRLIGSSDEIEFLSSPSNPMDDFCVSVDGSDPSIRIDRVQYDLAFVPKSSW